MSPPAFTPAEQEMQAIGLRLRQNGFTEIDIAEAIAYTRLYFAVAATGRGWEWLQAETRRLPEAPWSDFVQWPEHPDDLAWWRRHMGFEPASIIADVRAPTIAFFGREDPIVPAPANAGRLRELYRGAAPLEIVTAPGADHRLEVPAGTDALGRWTFPRISPPVMRALEAFLLEVATMKQ
jgi:pimeloyl-ACP methyl ester carboxylesterase